MKFLTITLLLFSQLAFAQHEMHGSHGAHHDHQDMEPGKAMPGTSLYQLEGKWTDAQGKTVELKSLAGEKRLVAMMYTRCQTACPLLVDNIAQIISKLPKKSQNMKVNVFSFDSDYEKPETMTHFKKMRKLGSNWEVMRADADTVAELAAALGVRYKKLPNGEFIHSNSIFLIDAKGVVLTQKDGLNTDDKAFVKAIKDSK